MSDIAIQVEGLSKLYRIGGRQERYKTLRDTLTDAAVTPFRRLSSLVLRPFASLRVGSSSNGDERRKTNAEWIWALKDVSFEVRRGEVVGIIGRNGAGKTTLLKILSRITEPTEGYAEIRGRVGSLLEVGTGFHPELTGRENIYLNGAILGMKKAEIERKFDEIMAFAEIEKFVDTPVKRYSSGMYVRLAFAVAAHLQPEILLVDEVLAVGDSQFQKKCLGKMGEIAKGGRTVLFVSHNMGMISNLCPTAILLEAGRVAYNGQAKSAISKYLAVPVSSGDVDLSRVMDRTGNGRARFVRVVTRNGAGSICDTFTIGDDMVFDFFIQCPEGIRAGKMSIGITSAGGIPIYHLVAADAGFELNVSEEQATIRVTMKNQKLYPGEYYAHLWLADSAYEAYDRVLNAYKFTVVEGGLVVTRGLDRSAAVVHEVPEWVRTS